MTKEIGGYFELELLDRGGFPHDDGILLNSGRNALEYVLRALGDIRHIWVPYYTCEVILEPITKLHIPYSFYRIDGRLELEENLKLNDGDCLLFTNYFGLKDAYIEGLAARYGSHLIIDNAQAWYSEPIHGVSTIYSPRKFVGIPDGGIAYCPGEMDDSQFEQDFSFDRCSHLLKRLDMGATDGYVDFKANSHVLCNQPIKRMSKLTKTLLSSIDFKEIKRRRKTTFEQLHEALAPTNSFSIPDTASFACPMVYPYLTEDSSLRGKLIDNKIYVATYWPNVADWTMEGMLERELMEQLIPLPCDQRYATDDIKTILKIIR